MMDKAVETDRTGRALNIAHVVVVDHHLVRKILILTIAAQVERMFSLGIATLESRLQPVMMLQLLCLLRFQNPQVLPNCHSVGFTQTFLSSEVI